MPSFHFSIGDSSDGPIGMCGAVKARSKEQALEMLRESLPNEIPVLKIGEVVGIGYVNVYLNLDAIKVDDFEKE